jgi:hypothetical protein
MCFKNLEYLGGFAISAQLSDPNTYNLSSIKV